MNAYICITEPGSGLTQPITGFTIYSNVDNYSTPLVSNVPITNFTGSSCPYVLANVPEGTTTLRLYDFGAGCCIDIPYTDGFNICDICNPLGFSDNSSPNVGSISVGVLTGGCDPSIGQYYLVWYGPGTGSTNQVFTSASQLGIFNLPQLIHPLTGTNQVYLTAGQYRPVIQYIDLNGVVYSYAFGATGDCFLNNPLVILPYTANNGSGTGDYEHELTFSAATRPTLNQAGTIELSGNTKYVPFRFDGNLYSKQLVIEFSGSAYPTPILLENIFVGEFTYGPPFGLFPNANQTNFYNYLSPNPPYKQAYADGFFTRVLCLTGLTVNSGDTLTFYINSPYTEAAQINEWTFHFTLLSDFDCSACVIDTPKYLLKESSFSASSGACSSTTINFVLSGCSTGVDDDNDIYKYILNNSDTAYVGDLAYGPSGLISGTTTFGQSENSCGVGTLNLVQQAPGGIYPEGTCWDLATNFNINLSTTKFGISVENTNIGEKTIRFYALGGLGGDPNLVNLFTYLETEYNTIATQFPSSNDPAELDCFTALGFYLPTNPVPPASQGCDIQSNTQYFFARNNSSVTFTTTPNFAGLFTLYEMTIVAGINNFTTEVLNIPCLEQSCKGSNSPIETGITGKISSSVFANSNTFTNITEPNNNGTAISPNYILKKPWFAFFATTEQLESTNLTGVTSNIVKMYQYQFKTYPSTGATYDSPQTYLSPLSAVTCNSLSGKTFNPYTGDTFDYRSSYWKYNFYYLFQELPNVPLGYGIYTVPILSNGQLSNTAPTLIATGTGSTITVIDSNYFTP